MNKFEKLVPSCPSGGLCSLIEGIWPKKAASLEWVCAEVAQSQLDASLLSHRRPIKMYLPKSPGVSDLTPSGWRARQVSFMGLGDSPRVS